MARNAPNETSSAVACTKARTDVWKPMALLPSLRGEIGDHVLEEYRSAEGAFTAEHPKQSNVVVSL